MKPDRAPFDVPADMKEMVAQSVEQAQKAVNTYLQFIQSGMNATPWGKTDLNEKLGRYAEQNVASAFAFAQRLIHAKDVQDLARIQTEFVQTQIQALSDQAKDLGETAANVATSPLEGLSTHSS